MTDIQTALANANVVKPEHKFLYARGSQHPPYNNLDIERTYAKFKAEFLPMCPITDCLGREIRVIDNHFRKLLNLKHKSLGDQARAYMLIEALEGGTFDPSHYEALHSDRIRTLFWIPEVLKYPDAVFRNGHHVVKADTVFAKVYEKDGSKVKLVFTSVFGPRFDRRVETVTSYLTTSLCALQSFKGSPLYERSEAKCKQPSK